MFLFARVNPQSVFENKVLKRLFWLNWNEVIREWRRPHDEEHNDLHS